MRSEHLDRAFNLGLYEAAGMTGDDENMKQVRNRLACANIEGQEHGLLIEAEKTVTAK